MSWRSALVSALLCRRHMASIETIAQELEVSVDEVTPHYEAVLLASEATIADYLPVLVAKRVKAQYRLARRPR